MTIGRIDAFCSSQLCPQYVILQYEFNTNMTPFHNLDTQIDFIIITLAFIARAPCFLKNNFCMQTGYPFITSIFRVTRFWNIYISFCNYSVEQ